MKVNNRVFKILFYVLIILGTHLASIAVLSAEDQEYVDLSIEELMDIQVFSVSKKSEKASDAPAAIFVLTSDDIRRSAAQTIPDLLRMVPGLHVAQFNANSWSVSSRGFNGRFANKLLVLIDGRTVYTPIFSGVYWNEKDYLLEDIERIEVIRGPGGTLWGANAVNGVINIITKSAKETQGAYLTGSGGTEQRHFSGARYGTPVGENGWIRLYAKHYNRDSSADPLGGDAFDQTEAAQGGFRSEWQPTKNDVITVQGDIFDGDEQEESLLSSDSPPFQVPARNDSDFQGGNILTRWEHTISPSSDLSVQFFYDRTEKEILLTPFEVDTFDLEVQHRFAATDYMEFTWGGGVRIIEDDIQSHPLISFSPQDRTYNVISGFIQTEIDIIQNTLKFIAGTKVQDTYFTGLEVQPTARAVWTPNAEHTVWAAFSRAVRSPSRVDEDIVADIANFPLPDGNGVGTLRVLGDDGFESEVLQAYEVGYRVQPIDKLYVDLSTFIFDYDDLSSVEAQNPYLDTSSGTPRFITPYIFDNRAEATAYGAELAVTTQLYPWWRLRGSYSYLNLDLSTDSNSTSLNGTVEELQNPEHLFSIHSRVDLPYDTAFDTFVRYVDSLPEPNVSSYIELDVRLAHQLSKSLELAIIGNNLLKDDHLEFQESFLAPTSGEIQRSVYGQVTWRYGN